MSALANAATLSGADSMRYRTRAAVDEALISFPMRLRASNDGWMTCIQSMREWRSTPPDWEEECIPVPSRRLLLLAEELAFSMRSRGFPEPMRVLPDGEGGVVFERRQGPFYETLSMMTDGTVALKRFRSGRMISSELLNAQSSF